MLDSWQCRCRELTEENFIELMRSTIFQVQCMCCYLKLTHSVAISEGVAQKSEIIPMLTIVNSATSWYA